MTEKTTQVETERVTVNGYDISTNLETSARETAACFYALITAIEAAKKSQTYVLEVIKVFKEMEIRYNMFSQGLNYSIEMVAVAIAKQFLASDAAKENPEEAENSIQVLVAHEELERRRQEKTSTVVELKTNG